MIERQLGRDDGRLSHRPLFKDFAKILSLHRREFPHPKVIEDQDVGLHEFVPKLQIGPRAARERLVFEQRRHTHEEYVFPVSACVQSRRLSNEGFPDTRLSDK